MAETLERLMRLGAGDATLWVFEENPQAVAFYERHGFAADGARQTHDWAGGALAVHMRRTLGMDGMM